MAAPTATHDGAEFAPTALTGAASAECLAARAAFGAVLASLTKKNWHGAEAKLKACPDKTGLTNPAMQWEDTDTGARPCSCPPTARPRPMAQCL